MNVIAPSKLGVTSSVDKTVFDVIFSSEKKLLELLVATRGSSLPVEEKMELRDLVLEYVNIDDTRKQIVKDKITEVLTHYSTEFLPLVSQGQQGMSTVSTPKSPETNLSKIGNTRPAPSFKPVSIAKPDVEQVSSTLVTEATTPSVEPSEIIEPPKVVATTPVSEETTSPAEPVASESQSVPTEAVVTTPAADAVSRISEIKRLVNSKVGNPVNLMETDNNIGREYMNALLDAMKKTSGGGQPGELDAAMSRLEASYKSVEMLLQKGGAGDSSSKSEPQADTKTPVKPIVEPSVPVPPIPKPDETPAPPPVPPPTPQPTPAVNVPESVTPPSAPEPNVVQPAPATKAVKVPVLSTENTTPKPSDVTPAVPPKAKRDTEPRQGLFHQVEEDLFAPDAVEVENDSSGTKLSPLKTLANKLHLNLGQEPATPVSEPVTPPAPTDAVKPKVGVTPTPTPNQTSKVPESTPPAMLTSAASTETVPEQMSSLKASMDKKEAESSLPPSGINSHEVTAGLEQLLSEWSLFKSSGFLGVGPNGIDHPLFKKLSNLPMAAIISGRFEGATPEIKQSITDYMNGWRYEQGLVHEMGEVFEHYLRRVIFQILERQSKSPKA